MATALYITQQSRPAGGANRYRARFPRTRKADSRALPAHEMPTLQGCAFMRSNANAIKARRSAFRDGILAHKDCQGDLEKLEVYEDEH